MHNVISPHFSFRVRNFAEMRTGEGRGGEVLVEDPTQAAVFSASLSLPLSFTPSKCFQLVLLTAELHEEPGVRHLGLCSGLQQLGRSHVVSTDSLSGYELMRTF